MEIIYKSIGIIHSPFQTKKGMPIQPIGAKSIRGKVVVNTEYVTGLADLEGFSHIMLIYHFHESVGYDLQVIPFLDSIKRGVFATRAPKRPNPIGISVVELVQIKDNVLHIQNIDVIDGTPLLDIKPYIPGFDVREVHKGGWIEGKEWKSGQTKSDKRFE